MGKRERILSFRSLLRGILSFFMKEHLPQIECGAPSVMTTPDGPDLSLYAIS